MRYTIHVLSELARLNAATHAARKEAERVDFVLNATTNSITAAVRAGKPIDPQDLRYASEYAVEKARSDRAVAAAKAQDTARRAPLVRELRDVSDDPASAYQAIVATLTERYGAPSAEHYLSGKDRSGWEIETFSSTPPRWRTGRATFTVMAHDRGTILSASADNERFSRVDVPHITVQASAYVQRRIASGESNLVPIDASEELASSRQTAPVIATLATALDVIEHCVRYSRNEECAFLDAQAIADDAEYRRRCNVTPA